MRLLSRTPVTCWAGLGLADVRFVVVQDVLCLCFQLSPTGFLLACWAGLAARLSGRRPARSGAELVHLGLQKALVSR